MIAEEDSSGEVLSGNMTENMTSGEPPSEDTGFTTSGGGSIGEGGELSSGASSSEGTSSGESSSGDLCDRLTINCSRINRTELDSDRTRTIDDLDESNSGGSGGNLTWIQTSDLNSTEDVGSGSNGSAMINDDHFEVTTSYFDDGNLGDQLMPFCSNSIYGCCADGLTGATGPDQQGC